MIEKEDNEGQGGGKTLEDEDKPDHNPNELPDESAHSDSEEDSGK